MLSRLVERVAPEGLPQKNLISTAVNVTLKARVSLEVVASSTTVLHQYSTLWILLLPSKKFALKNSELTQRVAIAEQRIEMLGREL